MNEEEQAGLRDVLTLRIPPTEELRALTRQLFALAHRGAGLILRRQDFEGALPHECLANAARWVHTNPGSALLPGFILFNFGWALRHVRFTPHVGVFSAERELLDVTPHAARDDHPFLQHPGTDEQFQAAFAFGRMDLIYR